MSDDTKPEELKVIITFKGDKASVGIQRTGFDPVFFKKDGALGDVLAAIPGYTAEAEQQWETSPEYPKADLPTSPPAAITVNSPAVAATTKSKVQTPMF